MTDNQRTLRARLAESFEDLHSWSARKGWRLVYTSRWWREELMCTTEEIPGLKPMVFRALANSSSWVMRACMGRSKCPRLS